MVQLQLLDLMISRECGAVPMDAATRADLIDLTARVIAAVFHEEGEEEMTELLHNPKIKPEHLARKAIVYLRQSSDKQVRQNKESQLLQYAMAERVRALGWQEVEIINNDLGSSAGLAAAQREGFERVLYCATIWMRKAAATRVLKRRPVAEL